jgi:hypothetical protein
MFYQLGLRQFGAFGTMNLEPAPSIRQLLDIAIEEEGDLTLIGRSYQDIVKVRRSGRPWLDCADICAINPPENNRHATTTKGNVRRILCNEDRR